MHRFLSKMGECCLSLILDSTFVDGEVKEFKEVREVKAICFVSKYTSNGYWLYLLTTEGSDNFFNFHTC